MSKYGAMRVSVPHAQGPQQVCNSRRGLGCPALTSSIIESTVFEFCLSDMAFILMRIEVRAGDGGALFGECTHCGRLHNCCAIAQGSRPFADGCDRMIIAPFHKIANRIFAIVMLWDVCYNYFVYYNLLARRAQEGAMSYLKAEGIKKSFVTGELTTEVLKGVDFELDDGEFVAIVGESGSGKSTLLYILAGIDSPTEGKVTLLGKDLNEISDGELAAMRRKVFSFVYQFGNLVPNLTVYENVALPLSLDGKREDEYRDGVNAIIDELGLSERKKSFPRQLSGGEQQRVAIARALVTSPKIIFLDEPTGSLDKERGRQVMEILKDINERRGVALLMVTHSDAHAAYATRIVRMEDGTLMREERA